LAAAELFLADFEADKFFLAGTRGLSLKLLNYGRSFVNALSGNRHQRARINATSAHVRRPSNFSGIIPLVLTCTSEQCLPSFPEGKNICYSKPEPQSITLGRTGQAEMASRVNGKFNDLQGG
jgi:hypothetical protein